MSRPRQLEPRPVVRLQSFAGRLPAVILCALAAHAAVYGSVAPTGAEHTYFAWYAPAVTALSSLSLVVLPLVLAVSLGGRRPSRLQHLTRIVLAGGTRDHAVSRRAMELAAGSVSFLVGQETLERSLATHAVSLPAFDTSTWLVLVAAATMAAVLVALVGRVVDTFVSDLLDGPAFDRPSIAAIRRPSVAAAVARPRPLAVHGGLRAPPTLP